mgnify:CR=1 FL=1
MDIVTITEICDECGSEYSIEFDFQETQEEPTICPFCGHKAEDYIVDTDDEDYYYDEE